MINGRAKGHAFERELIKKFQDEFGDCADHLKRNLDQYQTSGHWHKKDWWEQTLTSAGDSHVPILIYKYDRQPIKFVFRLSDLMGKGYETETSSVDYETGIMLMRELLEHS